MWRVANTFLVSGTASLVLGVAIAALVGYVITRDDIGESTALQIGWAVGIYTAGIVLGGGFLMTITGLALMWTARPDESDEQPGDSEDSEEPEDD